MTVCRRGAFRLAGTCMGWLALSAHLIAPTLGAAHHSFAMFDPGQNLTLHGTVREVRWTNPHVFIQLLMAREGNTAQEWSIELTSPEHLARAGWKPGTLKSGDSVTLIVHPMRDGSFGAQFVSGIGPDGMPIGAPAKSAGGTPVDDK